MTNIEIEMMCGDVIKAELYPDVFSFWLHSV